MPGHLTKSRVPLFLIIGALWFISGVNPTFAQSPVTVTMQVFPPYSPYLSDWTSQPNKILITLQSATGGPTYYVRLATTITGDNGIKIVSDPTYKPTQPIVVSPGLPLIVSVTNLKNLFDVNHLKFTNITLEEVVYGNGLPEGVYQVCVRAYDYNTGQPLSDEAPSGCSTPLTVVQAEPPFILQPACDAIITTAAPQSLVFSWTHPAEAPLDIQYSIKIVEVVPLDREPNDAMNSATTPTFYQQIVTATSFLYGSAQPLLVKGKRYAFRVTATDPKKRVVFKNNGQSQVCSFTYGTGGPIIPISVKPPEKPAVKIPLEKEKPKLKPIIPQLNTVVQGRMVLDVPGSFAYPLPPLPKAYVQLVVKCKLVKLVSKKIEGGAVYDTVISDLSAYASLFPELGIGKVLDNAVTDDNGEFTFSFSSSDSMGLLRKKPISVPGGMGTIEGIPYRYAAVVVGSSYIKSPANEIIIQPGQVKHVGDLIARDMRTTVTGNLNYEFADPNEYIVWPLKNTAVKLVIKYIIDDKGKNKKVVIPWNAPDNNHVLDVTTSDNNGSFKFSFIYTGEMGLVAKNQTFKIGSVEFPTVYTGDVFRVARVVFDNAPYYLSPSQDIILSKGKQLNNLGQFIAYVRSYGLTVTTKASLYPKDQVSTAGGILPGMLVYLLRKPPRPNGVPANEGLPRPESPETWSTAIGTMEVIAKGTTDSDGKVFFKRLVKSIAPGEKYYLWGKSKPDDKIRNYQTPIFSVFGDSSVQQWSVFADEYIYDTRATTIELHPRVPRIAGRVVRLGAQNVPVAGAQVRLRGYELVGQGKVFNEYGVIQTDNNGRFLFDNLSVKYDGDKVVGPVYWLWVRKIPEYRDTVLTTVLLHGDLPLKPGEQIVLDPFELTPAARIKGKVADENGNGVTCGVTVGDGVKVDVKPVFEKLIDPVTKKLVLKARPGSFETWATGGKNKVVIDAGVNYLLTDTTVSINPGVQDLGIFKVYQAKHRLRVFVHGATPVNIPGESPWIPIKDARVRIEELDKEFTTNGGGIVEYSFTNADSNFAITVWGPTGKDYEPATVAVKIPISKNWTLVDVPLKNATHIWGNVYVGTENKAVPDAHVYLDQSSTGPVIETWTDVNGYYILHNVPIRKVKYPLIQSQVKPLVVRAVKSQSNYIGDEKRFFSVPDSGRQVDFSLKVYEDMDITHLMGFPIEVKSLDATGGKVKITGSFVTLDLLTNSQFSAQQPTLPFNSLAIVPSQSESTLLFGKKVPVAQPEVLPLLTEVNELKLKVYGTFMSRLKDKKIGIELDDDGSGKGVIKGKVSVGQSNFQFNGLGFSGGGFWLARPDEPDPVKKMRVPAITASKQDPVNAPAGFLVVDSSGSTLKYTLYGFDADAGPSESFLFGDSARLKTTIHTDLLNVQPKDLKLDIGNVVLRTTKLGPVAGTNLTAVDLGGGWSIKGDTWALTNGWFYITKGKLKTGVVDVPFTNLQLTKTELVSTANTFQLTSLTLIDMVPLTVTGEPGFGYDQGIGAWKLWVSKKPPSPTCAYIKALPGMAGNDTIFVNSFYLSSKGDKNFSLLPNHITIHKVADYQLSALQTMNNYIELKGCMDLSIPDMGKQTVLLMYKNQGGKLKFEVEPFWFTFVTKGVVLDFPSDSLDAQGFRAHGTVSESNKFKFNVTLYRTVDSTAVWVDTKPVKQSLWISEPVTSMQNIAGSMRVKNGAWQNFWFAGDLTGTTGASGRLKFTVIGNVVADNQQVGVTNITTPFGDIGLTYDFDNHRLCGNLDFSQGKELMGGAKVFGQANMLVDGDGWYFLGGGSLNFSGYGGTVGILFGNYPLTSDIVTTFAPYSVYHQKKGKFPPSFPNPVKGFYFEGAVQVPVITDIDADFVVVKGYAYIHLGGDVHLGMNFADANTYGAGLYFYGEAGAGIGGSAVILCAGASGAVLVDLALDGEYKSDGSWFVEGDASLEFKVAAYAGAGTACDADCESICCSLTCPLMLCCVKDEWSGSFGMGLNVHFGSDGTSMSPYLK